MNKKNRLFLLVVGPCALYTALWGWAYYLQGNDVFCMISWKFVWLGIFAWGDGMVFGTLLFLASIWLWFLNKPVWTGLFFSAYYVLRSFVEVLYDLNAQFSVFMRPWEAFMPKLAAKVHLPVIDLFVFGQIMYTAVCIVSIMVFLFWLKKYFKEQ